MSPLQDMIARNRAGEKVGLPCFCTANPQVLRAILAFARRTGLPTVIEATCNQVNQDGGYTGMTAADFMQWLTALAAEAGVPTKQLILGGDHLGPNPWRHLPADEAMAKARALVESYVRAGFRKIHLDASMACGGEPTPSFELIAERAAELCAVAEQYAPDASRLIYVIGTEVPIPGGETEEPDALDVTSVDRLDHTIEAHRAAFAARGLDAAWARIVSVVTQPGVDFGHSSVYAFHPDAAQPLKAAIEAMDGLTFEAHSTDYQPNDALSALVQSHFFFLKVGPELTFRFREAVFALSRIEEALEIAEPSNIRALLNQRMIENPQHWQAYYHGSEADLARLRTYSYSDRIRYYWSDPVIAEAVERLFDNLGRVSLPETIVSQHVMGFEFGDVPTHPQDIAQRHVTRCVQRYFAAAGHTT